MSDPCQQLESFLSGELDLAAGRDFESHLAECGECSEQIRIAQSLDSMIQEAWSAVQVPNSLLQNAMAKESQRTKRVRSVFISKGALLAVAALLLIAFAVGSQLFGPDENQPIAVDPPKSSEDQVERTVELASKDAMPLVRLLASPKPTTSILIPEETNSTHFTVLGVHQVVNISSEDQSN